MFMLNFHSVSTLFTIIHSTKTKKKVIFQAQRMEKYSPKNVTSHANKYVIITVFCLKTAQN